MTHPEYEDELSENLLSFRHKIDIACDEFEEELKRGNGSALGAILDRIPEPNRESTFEQLLLLMIDYANRGLCPWDERKLLADFPQHADVIAKLRTGMLKNGSDDVHATIDLMHVQGLDRNAEVSPDYQTLYHDSVPPTEQSSASSRIQYFGDYELLDEIARGGMGVVYRARQTSLNRLVALKMILSGELAGTQELARFHSEAEAAAKLDHPNIVPIFEIGQHQGQPYFSMGLVNGPSLSNQMRSGPLECRKACLLVVKIAQAIDYAHSVGVIHRDIKPGNILIDASGEPHVTDFGLAKHLHGTNELTTTGQVLGTPAYMPPEQARGDLALIGPSSDIYSLGALLYSMLAGRPPHAAGSAIETLRQVVEVEPLSVRSLNPSIPKDLETICARCLAKEPSKRFANAGDLAKELQRFLRGEPIHSRPISRLERSWRWARRHPAFASLSGIIVLLTSALAIGGPIAALTQSHLRSKAQANELRAVRNENRANQLAEEEAQARKQVELSQVELAAAKARTDRSLYARTISLAYGQWQEGNLQVAKDTLASIPVEQRDFEWFYIDKLCHQHQQELIGLKSVPRFVAAVSDTDYVVAGGTNSSFAQDPNLYLWKKGNDQPSEVRNVFGLIASSDGKRLVVIPPDNPSKFQVTDTVTGAAICSSEGHPGGTSFASFGGPDESQIVTVGRDKTLRVWSSIDGSLLYTLQTPNRRRLSPAALSPDGTLVAWRRADDGAIEIRKLKKLSPEDKDLPDVGSEAVFESSPVKKLENGEFCVAFSPDGKLLAVGGHSETDLIRVSDFSFAGRFSGYRGKTNAIAFTSDSSRIAIASAEAKVRIFDVKQCRELTSMTGHGVGVVYGITGLGFDRSGERVITGGADRVVKVWDAWNGDRGNRSNATPLTAQTQLTDLPEPRQTVDYLTMFGTSVEQVKLFHGGNWLLGAGGDGSVKIVDIKEKKIVRQWEGAANSMASADLHETSKRVAAGAGGINSKQPGLIVAWNLDDGQEQWRTATEGPVRKVVFTPDGRFIAVAVGSENVTVGRVMLLRAEDGSEVWRNQANVGSQRDLAIAPDGSWFATVGSGGITIWETQSGKSHSIGDKRNFLSVAASKDGKRIAGGTTDWVVRVYEADSGNELWSTLSHHGAVMSLVFSANDRRVISTSVDSTIRIFDSEHGDMILTIFDTAEPNLCLDATDDGDMIVVGGLDPNIRLLSTDAKKHRKSTQDPSEIMADGASRNVDWKTLFRDDFERKEMGDRWQFVSGTWEIKGGTAVGSLQPSSVEFSALLVCKQIVPRDHEFSFDVSVDKPMLIQTILSDQMHENSIGSIFIGIPTNAFNFGEKGGLIYRVVNKAYSQESSRRDPSFEFVPGRVYRVSMRREGSLISMLLDGKLYRSAEVSIDTPLPYLNLQAMFGPINSTLTIDNAELRVPSDSDRERRAMELVQQLFNERELRPLVLSALKDRDWQEEKDSASLEEEMRRLIDLWPQNEKSLLKRIQELTLSRKFKSGEELTPVDFQFLYDWLDKEVRSKTDDVWRTAAECASLAGNQAASDAARIESQKMHEWRRGCIHPVDAALAAISYTRQAKHAEAEEKMELLNQLALAPHWKDDPHLSYWKRIATQLVSEAAIEKPVHPNDSDIQSAAELKQLTWDMQAALFLDGNSEFLAELLADDAVRIDRRTADDTNPLITQREPWLETERLHSLPGPITGIRLTRVKVDVTKNLDNPIVTSQFVFERPNGHFRWLQIDDFSRKSDNLSYRLSKQTIQTLHIFLRGIEFNIERDGWTRADADVEAAQAKQDKELELGTLLLASRKQEAFEVVKTLIKEKQDARSLILVADAARATHRGDVMRKAMKKAIELDPLVTGPPYVRAFAAQQLFGEKPEKLRDNLTIRVPSFYKIASKELIGTGGSGLAAWHPTIESLVGVLTIPKDNDPNENQGFEKNIQELIESRESTYGATTLRQRTMTFAGHTAIEFVQRGSGIGRALAGFGQGNPTIQRFVVIDSPSSCLMLFVSAFESEFVLRDSEFEQVWRTLEYR